MDKDYYKILGVQESDSAETIKHVYRKLARVWHPDIAGNSMDAISRFKEINEAYEILSDVHKRANYDKARAFYKYAKNGSSSSSANTQSKSTKSKSSYTENPQSKGFNLNWNEFVSKYSHSYNSERKEQKVSKKGDNIYADIEITVFEAVSGVEKVINVLQTGICPKCGGRKFVNGSLCECCKGKGETSVHRRFTVKIPAGIKNGAKIRLANEGCAGINGGQNGDLLITVLVKESKDYKTDGLNIIKTVGITPFEAVLGADIEINLMGNKYKVKIPPCTQNGQKIRLSGCGIVQNEKIGDMIIIVEIRIPKTFSNEEINLYKKLSEISTTIIRDNANDR